MKKRWIVIAAIIFIAGILTGVLLSRGETPTLTSTTPTQAQTPSTTQTLTPTPTSTPRPSTTITPTPTPTITQTSIPAGAISVQEFFANARAGKYKLGEWITVSAIYENYYKDPKKTVVYFFFGPQTNGDYLITEESLTSAGTIPFYNLNKGDEVTVEGLYKGSTTINGKTGGILDYGRIIK